MICVEAIGQKLKKNVFIDIVSEVKKRQMSILNSKYKYSIKTGLHKFYLLTLKVWHSKAACLKNSNCCSVFK